MSKIECETCIKRKTRYCPNSSECLETEDMPHYKNRIMILEENELLKTLLMKDHHKIHELADVIDEAREYINKDCNFNGTSFFDKFVAGKKILQILDKVKE